MDKITYKSIKKMPEVNAYIEQGNRVLGILGYTEHSRGHAVKVAETAGEILEKLGLPKLQDICMIWEIVSTV